MRKKKVAREFWSRVVRILGGLWRIENELCQTYSINKRARVEWKTSEKKMRKESKKKNGRKEKARTYERLNSFALLAFGHVYTYISIFICITPLFEWNSRSIPRFVCALFHYQASSITYVPSCTKRKLSSFSRVLGGSSKYVCLQSFRLFRPPLRFSFTSALIFLIKRWNHKRPSCFFTFDHYFTEVCRV